MRDERADEPSEKVDARAATFDIKKRRLEWRADGYCMPKPKNVERWLGEMGAKKRNSAWGAEKSRGLGSGAESKITGNRNFRGMRNVSASRKNSRQKNLPYARSKICRMFGTKFYRSTSSLALLLRTILRIARSFEWFNENDYSNNIRLSSNK